MNATTLAAPATVTALLVVLAGCGSSRSEATSATSSHGIKSFDDAKADAQPEGRDAASDAKAIARHLRTVHMSSYFGVIKVAHADDEVEILTDRVKDTFKGDAVTDALCTEIHDWQPAMIQPARIMVSGWKPTGDDPGRAVLGYCEA